MVESKDKKTAEEPGFEVSLARLEKLVQEMESGSLSLDRMMAHFEEGMGLVKVCNQRLNEVEARIDVLVRKGDQLTTQPLPDDAADQA